MPTIAHRVRCPECGGMSSDKVIFFRENQTNKAQRNMACRKCEKKNKQIIGYDNEISINNDLAYVATSCSGIAGNFNQENLRCPICNAYADKVSKINHGSNIPCMNPDCPAIGFDYNRGDDNFCVTASGIVSDVSEYSNIKYSGSKLGTRKKIGYYED